MQKTQLFPTPVWSKILEHNFDKLKLKFLNKHFGEGVLASNNGGYQSQDVRYSDDCDIKDLINILQENLEEVVSQCGLKRKYDIGNCWININEKGHYNNLHYHPKSLLTGVLYLEIDEDMGDLVLCRPDLIKHYTDETSTNPDLFQTINIKPKKNSLIIFPSWIEHKVEMNNTDKPRVSFAFNTTEKL